MGPRHEDDLIRGYEHGVAESAEVDDDPMEDVFVVRSEEVRHDPHLLAVGRVHRCVLGHATPRDGIVRIDRRLRH
jgi:hypothetical protein